MTAHHNSVGDRLAFRLQQQLPLDQYRVSGDRAHVRMSETRTYIPDVAVISMALVEQMKREQPTDLEVHREPLPLIVEVWSPSTGEEDRTEKLPGYQQRGDAEIWLLRPQERALVASVREPDGTYSEHVYNGGGVRPRALPDVAIDLDELFNL